MGGIAPKDFSWIDDESRKAKSPITRDLLREMELNLNHLIIRINGGDGSSENLEVSPGLYGHEHFGEGEGGVMPRPLDSRFARLVHPCEEAGASYAERACKARRRAVFARYMGGVTSQGWEDLVVLPNIYGNEGVGSQISLLPSILLSPGVQFVGATLAYVCVAKAFTREKKAAEIRLGARADQGGAFIYGEGVPIFVTASEGDDNFGAVRALKIGGLLLSPDGAEQEKVKAQMPDVSEFTKREEGRLVDLNLQVKRVWGEEAPEFRDIWIIIWGYALFEAYEEFGGE